MTTFAHVSVRQRLVWLIVLASALALLCVTVAAVFFELTTFRPRAVSQLSAEARVLEEVLSAPLDFGLKEAAVKGLNKHCEDRAIVLAALYNTNRVFAAYRRDGAGASIPPAPKSVGHEFTARHLSLWWPVRNNEGVAIGSLYLMEALPPLHARLSQYAIMAGAVLLALAVVGAVLIRGVRRHVLSPLAALVETTAHVTEHNDYSIRATTPRKDELGRLAHAFNQMLEVIGNRDADLREASARIQNVFDAATEVGIISTDTHGTVTLFNSGAERMLGYLAAEVTGKMSLAAWHLPLELAIRSAELSTAFGRPIRGFDVFVESVRRGQREAREWTCARKDGTRLRVYLVITAVRDAVGAITGFLAMASDITERERALAELAESRHLYQELVASVPLGVYRMTASSEQDFHFEFVSERFCEVTGVERAKVMADRQVAFALIDPVDREEFDRRNVEAIRHKTPFLWEGRAVVAGRSRWLHIESHPTVKEDCPPYWTGVVFDVTERKQAEESLRKSQARLEEAQALAKIGSWELDVASNRGEWSREMFRLHGRAVEQGNPTYEEFMALVQPEDRERLLAHYQALLRGQPSEDLVYRVSPSGGDVRHLRIEAAVIRDAAGQPTQLRGTCADITEQLEAELERRRLEDQLRQVQKMEAIGQLSGGVAHDFNNLLTIIDCHVNLMRLGSGLSPDLLESIEEIGQATTRAANLTRQLLAFSRQQTMQLKTLDLSEVVFNMTRMLQRIVGEDIKMDLHYTAQATLVRADAGMLGQALLNLVVNARDAMPNGGSLVIETAASVELTSEQAAEMPQAVPGRFASLSVRDTGCGIPPEVLPKIFEPFFTTKDVGKGTGLGLATVYGIVQQHSGWVTVHSEVGAGTVVRIYLPASDASASGPDSDPAGTAVSRALPPGGKETILLVEDEPALRSLGCRILRRMGYSVLDAPNGLVALDLWKKHRGEIRLLLTDMLMPEGMSGRDLARRLHRDAPLLPVIYTSGYSPDIAGKDFPLQEGVNFLAKPFNPSVLGEAVRASLAASGLRPGG